MLLLGAGAGIAFNPVLLAAMGDVEPHESGLASGVVNTSFMMGGALGLAILVALSEGRTTALLADGTPPLQALNAGLQVAFAAGAVSALVGRRGRRRPAAAATDAAARGRGRGGRSCPVVDPVDCPA